MKIIISVFLSLLLTGCSTLNFQNSVSSKEELINKANKGNIKAMIALNKYYKFPETKEGLDFYNKWYDTINEEDKVSDILEFAKIFAKYNDMFINGEQKSENLYDIAINLGSKEALFLQVENYAINYNEQKRVQIQEKILENPTEDDFIRLYNLYKKLYRNKEAKEIKALMLKNGFTYKENSKEKLEKLKKLRYKKDKENKEANKILDEIIASNNPEEIFKAADYLKKRYQHTYALKLYEAGLLLDTTNANAYYEASKIYKKLKPNNPKALEYLKKAANNNHFEANSQFLREYTKDQNHIEEYFALVEKLQQTPEGKRALADFYYKNNKKDKANQILDELAKKGDEEAILTLALRIPSNYKFNPEESILIKKWQEYIIESNNITLKNKFEEKITPRAYYNYYKIMEKKAIEEKNIIVLRGLYEHNKYQKKELALKYLQEAANYADVKSNLILANEYLKSKEDEQIYKGLTIYETLAQKGDIKATKLLAEFYKRPPYKKEKFKDYKKAIKYYEKVANTGDLEAIRKLAELFICGECESKNFIDDKQAKIYLERLVKEGNSRDLFSLGWLYNFKEKDLQKAKEYYEKAGTLGYSRAYYNLAYLYFKHESYKNSVIEVDYKKAIEYLKKGEKLNNSQSINLLGLFYEKGYGVEKNIETAVSYYKKIANIDTYASYNLARYYKGKKDYTNALKYYEKGNTYGNAESMNELGVFYEKGLGVKKDINKALEYYKKAYSYRKHPSAAYNIGLIYHYAKGGIKKDLKLAKQWYEKSTLDDAKKQLKKLK